MTHKNQTTDDTSGGLSFTEQPENQIILCTTPKRRDKIKIYVPVGQFPYWKICYENGGEIEGLGGRWMSRGDATKAVIQWERLAKKTEGAKQFEMFGDKQPPVLKRKKTRNGPRAKTNIS